MRWATTLGSWEDLEVEGYAPSYFYVPQRQVYRPVYGYTFFVRTAGDVEQPLTALRQAVNGADPSVPVFNAMPLADYIAAPLAGQRTAVQLLGILAALALLLAAIGLYGVISFAVSPNEPAVYVAAVAGMMLVAAAAITVPALRATRVDPCRHAARGIGAETELRLAL